VLCLLREISGRSCGDVPGAWHDDLQIRDSRSVAQGLSAFSVPLRPKPLLASRKGIPKRWVASRHLPGSAASPGVRGSAPVLSPMSALPLRSLCPSPSVARVPPPEPVVSRAARRPSAAALDTIGYDF
jgi:hypothetical protein